MRRLKKETLRLGSINALITCAGFAFHILLGRTFGISKELDCLFVGLTLFGLTSLSNNYLTSLLIPVFNEIKKDNIQESILFVDVVIKWSAIISIVIIFLVFFFDKWIVFLIAPGFDLESIALGRQIIRILVLSLFFTNINQTLTLTFNALHYYSIPAIIGFLRPGINILSIFILVPYFGILGIAIGDVFASFLRMIILFLFFRFKIGWYPTKRFYHRKLPELINKSSRMSINDIIWSLRGIIIRNIASRLGEGGIALFSYAEKLIRIMMQISIGSIIQVYYSRVSQWISSSKWDKVKSLYTRASRANMALSLFAASAAIVFLPALLRTLFLESSLTSGEIHILSVLFNILLISYLSSTFRSYLTRIVFAQKKVGVVSLIVTIGILILSVAAFLLSKRYGVYGLTIGVVFSQLSSCMLYYFFTKRILDLNIITIAVNYFRSIMLSFVFSVIGLAIRHLITNDIILILLIMPLWCIGYFALARIFLKEEVHTILSK